MAPDWSACMHELTLQLDKERTIPLFEQLYSYIKKEITAGHYKRNEKLPSKRRLAASLLCSQNTVQAAYNQLADEGYLKVKPKSGYYVAELDGLLSMDITESVRVESQKQTNSYSYDFSHQGVDFECFPFEIWRRLTRDVINDSDDELMKTGHSQGHINLRFSIARYLHHSRGVNCTPEQIVISSGTEFLLQLLIQLFDDAAVYAIENPGYEKLAMIFQSNRARVKAIPLDENGMIPKALDKSGASIACITPSHQFPTGLIMPVTRRIQMLNWANDMPERFIVEDDYDSEFRYSGKPIPSLQGLDQQGKVIYMGAFSKSLSPALRISYMVLPETLARRYREKLSFYICPVPTIEQKTLQQFIDKGYFERHLNRVRNLYRQKREAAVAAIREALPGADIRGASAGLHFTLRVNNGMSEQELITAAQREQVKVYGLSRYYSVPSETEEAGAVLLGFATLKIDNIPDAVGRLKKAWYKGPTFN
jgi:GntR family transcriptional regulator/MocR family aminotransferase